MGVDTPTPAISPAILVSDYINLNSSTIVNQVFPLNNFGFLKNMPTLITMDLHYFLLTILQLEYGVYYISSRDQDLFKNTYTQSFWRLLQLMSLDTLVDMKVLLQNNFQSEEYIANVSQGAGLTEQSVSGQENVVGQSTGVQTGNTSGNQTTDNTSTENTNVTVNNESNSNSNVNSTSNTSHTGANVIGATSTIGTQLNLPMPDQSLIGSTNMFADKLGTQVDGIGVPQLNMSYTDSATQSSGHTTSQNNSEESSNESESNQVSEIEEVSNSTTQGTDRIIGNSTTQHSYNNQAQATDSGTTNITTSGNTENSSKQGSSGFVGSRRKGYTTNAIVATQLLAMLRGYQEINTALEWWTEQFRWIQPFLGMDKWDTNNQIYTYDC